MLNGFLGDVYKRQQYCRAGAVVGSQAMHQRHRFPLREIRKLDSLSDIERRSSRIANQVRGSSDPQQAERQPFYLGIGRPAIEALANSGKEFIGRERETANRVNFVHEYDDPILVNRQDRVGEHPHKSPHGTKLREPAPAILNLVLQAKLLAGAFNEPVIPLLRRQILPKTGQVKNGDPRAVFAQAGRGSHHERRLTHLPRRQHVADFPRLQRLVKHLVGRTFNVGTVSYTHLYSASRVFGSRFRETFPARHSDAVALAASDSGAIGAGWRQKKPALALKALPAASPVEFGLKQSGSNISCLYPVYVHGQVYLAAGQGNAAAAEFQKILDHGGIVWNCWTGALAHLGVARANALQARTSQGGDADAALSLIHI